MHSKLQLKPAQLGLISTTYLPKNLTTYVNAPLDKVPFAYLSPALLVFIIINCLFGLLTNGYSANYMKKKFDLSKLIYKTLFWCCIINVIGFLVLLITSLFIFNESDGKLICIVFQVSLQFPLSIIQSYLLQMSFLRCLVSCSKKNAEKLISFQKSLVAFMSPLPFACLGSFYIYKLSNDEPLNFGRLVSNIKSET